MARGEFLSSAGIAYETNVDPILVVPGGSTPAATGTTLRLFVHVDLARKYFGVTRDLPSRLLRTI